VVFPGVSPTPLQNRCRVTELDSAVSDRLEVAGVSRKRHNQLLPPGGSCEQLLDRHTMGRKRWPEPRVSSKHAHSSAAGAVRRWAVRLPSARLWLYGGNGMVRMRRPERKTESRPNIRNMASKAPISGAEKPPGFSAVLPGGSHRSTNHEGSTTGKPMAQQPARPTTPALRPLPPTAPPSLPRSGSPHGCRSANRRVQPGRLRASCVTGGRKSADTRVRRRTPVPRPPAGGARA